MKIKVGLLKKHITDKPVVGLTNKTKNLITKVEMKEIQTLLTNLKNKGILWTIVERYKKSYLILEVEDLVMPTAHK